MGSVFVLCFTGVKPDGGIYGNIVKGIRLGLTAECSNALVIGGRDKGILDGTVYNITIGAHGRKYS